MRRVALLIGMAVLAIVCGTSLSRSHPPRPSDSAADVAVYVLSRGKGVPEAARALLRQAHGLFERAQQAGNVTEIIEQRIGLEGETRLCATFADRGAADALFNDIAELARGVDLVNVKREPCRAR